MADYGLRVVTPTSDADRTKMSDLFDYLDANDDGFISLDELKVVLPEESVKEVKATLAVFDLNMDGRISKQEWLRGMATLGPEGIKVLHQKFFESPMSPIFLIAAAGHVAFVIYMKTRK